MSTPIVINPKGAKYFTINMPSSALHDMKFQADNVSEVGYWLVKNRDSFKDWQVSMDSESSPNSESWTASVTFAGMARNDWGIETPTWKKVICNVSYVNPPKIRTLEDMTDTEKVNAIIKALAKQGIKLEVQ